MGYYTTKKEIGDYVIFEEANPSIFKYIKLNGSFCGGNKKRDKTKKRTNKRTKKRTKKRDKTKKRTKNIDKPRK